MLSKLRIGPKLLLAPGVVLILLVVLAAGAYLGLMRQNQSLENIVLQRAARLRAAAELMAGANRAHTESYQLLTWINASFSQPRLDALVRDMHRRHAALERQFTQLDLAVRSAPDGGAERRFVQQSQAAHAQYVKALADVIELSAVDQSMAANAMSKAERAFEVASLRLEELSRLEQTLSEQAYLAAEAEFKNLSAVLPLVVLLSIALSLLVTMVVRNAMLKEVRQIGAAAADLAEGKLTVSNRAYGGDEIAEASRALDTSIRNLNSTLKTILASAQAVAGASREIALGHAAIVEMGQVSEDQLTLVRQAALAAGRLQHQATGLSQAVAMFKLDEGADTARPGRGAVVHLASVKK